MELKLIDDKGASAGTMSASAELFGRDYSEALVHQVVTAYQANARSGNRAQKGRSDVQKSTKKPWRQRVRAVLVPVWLRRLCGAVAERSSRTHQTRTSPKK